MYFWLAFYGMPRIQKTPARRTRMTSKKHITIWPNCGTWTRRRKEKRKRPRRNFKATLIQAGGISTYHNSSSSPATYNSFLVTSSSSHPTGAMILQMVNIRSRLQLFLPVGITSTRTGWWSPVTMLMSSVAMSLCRTMQWRLLTIPPPGKQRYSGWTQTISTSSAWSGNNWRGDLMFTILLPFCRMLPVSLDNRAHICQYYFHWPVCCEIPCPPEI